MKKSFYLLVVVLLACSTFTSCKSKKKTLHKKIEKVSELSQQEVQRQEKIKADVTTYKILEKDQLTISPIDNGRPVQVIQGRDTIQFSNAKVDLNSSREQEQVKDKSETEKNSSEKSSSEKDSVLKEKHLDKESKGTSPALIWGLIVAGLAIGAFFYIKKKIPFI